MDDKGHLHHVSPEALQQLQQGNNAIAEDGTVVRPHWKTFGVGDEFRANGVRFRVRKVTKKDIIIRAIGPVYPDKKEIKSETDDVGFQTSDRCEPS